MTEPVWLAGARKLVGLKEIVGTRHEPKVVAFFADAGNPGVKDDETAWCAAFVGAMLKKAGIKGTGKLNARSYLDWGRELVSPKLGCIVVFKRGSSSWQGHVAFFLRVVGTKIEVLGGNQGNAVSIAQYPASSLLGYRWPTEAAPAVQPDDPGEPDDARAVPAKHKNVAPAAGGAAVAVGGGVAAAANAGIPWGWIILVAVLIGLGVAAWLFRDRIVNFIKGLIP